MNDKPTIEVEKVPIITKFIYTLGVLPTSYLMSMTYQEQVTWLCNYISQTLIPQINEDVEAIQELQNLFELLRTYVNDYFDNLDVQEEINNKLDEMMEDGSLTQLIKNYVDPIYEEYETEINNRIIEQNDNINTFKNNVNYEISVIDTKVDQATSGSPLVASSTSGMTDTTRIYVNTTDGYWYYYNGTDWTRGGVYQSSGLADESVTLDKLAYDTKFNLNTRINDKDELNTFKNINIDLTDNLENINIDNTTGELDNESSIRVSTPEYIYIPSNTKFKLKTNTDNYYITFYYYDEDFNFLYLNHFGASTTAWITQDNKARYVRFKFQKSDSTADITSSDVLTNIVLTHEKIEDYDVSYTHGENMVDTSKSTGGYLIGSSDPQNVQVSATYETTEAIKVETGETYIISSLRKLALYDNDFNYIENSFVDNSLTDYTFTPVSDGYVVFSYATASKSSLMMLKSATLPDLYIPYKKYLESDVIVKNTNLEYQDNILYNKKYVSCGDSFTEGDFSNSLTNNYIFTSGKYKGKKKVYPYFIGNRNNMNVINEAVSGSTMTDLGTRDDAFSKANGRYTQIPVDADYITLKFGINDDPSHQNAPLGTINDNTNQTFYGAWNVVMNYLITNHPQAKIGIIVSNGINDINYVNAIIEIAEKFGVAYINETTDNKEPLLIRTLRTDVDSTIKNFRDSYWEVNPSQGNGHPNELCHEYESTMIENFLRRM